MKIQSELLPRALDATNSTTPFIAFRIQGKKNKDSTVKVDHYSTAFGYVLSGALKATDPLYGTSYSLKAGQIFSLSPGQNSKLVISSAHDSTVAVVIVRLGYRGLDTVITDNITTSTTASLFSNPFVDHISPSIGIQVLDYKDDVQRAIQQTLPRVAVVISGSLATTQSATALDTFEAGTALLIDSSDSPLLSTSASTKILTFYPVSP